MSKSKGRGEPAITPATARDLARLGIRPPAGLAVHQFAPGEEVTLVVARFDLLRGPLLPDNVLGKCTSCGHPVQWRPHAPPSRRVCVECVSHGEDDQRLPTPG